MMKKYGILAAVLLLSACSSLNPLNWWSKPEPVQETVRFEPNRFLWQAAGEKLSFMNDVKDNVDGTMTTGWTAVGNAEYKVDVQVSSDQLRCDALSARVYKRLRSGQGWIAAEENSELNRKVEDAILNRARVLYRESLNLM